MIEPLISGSNQEYLSLFHILCLQPYDVPHFRSSVKWRKLHNQIGKAVKKSSL
jgi:hypothetical protein